MAKDTPVLTTCIAEFVGTFLLVFTIGCNVLSKTANWAPVSIACILMVSIYALGGISGANFNPAVSVALGISNSMQGPGMPWGTVGIYVGTQLVAALVGGMCYAILFWNAFNLHPTPGFNFFSAMACEFYYTFMLCYVVLNVACARCYSDATTGSPNQFFGLAIGFVIIAGAYGAGAISGGCFNPAVAFGIDVSSAGLGFGWCLFYTIAELLGAAVAVFLFRLVRPEDFGGATPGKDSMKSRLASEFIGTFILVLTVGLNVLAKSPAGAFSIAASLMCMIYATGDISGGHFNPAVTLALLLTNNFENAKTMAFYWCAQLLGGLTAAMCYSGIHNWDTFALGPGAGFSVFQAAFAELIFTFVLCYVVLAVAVPTSPTHSKSMFGLAIGACVTVGGFAIGSISGGSLNPAVSFGIALSHKTVTNALIYTGAEFAGAALAAGVHKVTHKKGM